MILIDNIHLLKKHYPEVWESMKKIEDTQDRKNSKITFLETKSGATTLAVEVEGHPIYLHSKYDPEQEAERIISQYKDLPKYNHIFYYGVGLGYHIREVLEKHPDMSLTIYEPNPEVLYHYLSQQSLAKLPRHSLKNLFIETNPQDVGKNLEQFISNINEEVLLVTLPSYERIFKDQFIMFAEQFKTIVQNSRTNMYAYESFQKRWTLNSMKNIPHILQTPNMIQEKRKYFENKPAIIVAAGPSLEEEIENLRHIKEHGLAYIFSVGSAINSLIEYDIYPDAACTYDPSTLNYKVFERVVEKGIKNIPLIFGSSVGFETLASYPGEKLHMIMDRDTVFSFYSGFSDSNVLHDSPSIALVTLELLSHLGCNTVYLVGQNLGYRNNKFYAKGISYEDRTTELNTKDKEQAFKVEDVYGNEMDTNKGFNNMRKQFERYTTELKHMEIINTTKGGAKIEGAPFQPLEEIITNRLIESEVCPDWHKGLEEKLRYDHKTILKQSNKMKKESIKISVLLKDFERLFKQIEQGLSIKQVKQLEFKVYEFDQLFSKLQKNLFYKVFLKPRNQLQYQLLLRNIDMIKSEKDIINKAKKINQHFGQFLNECRTDFTELHPIYEDMENSLLKLLSD
jgi:hypothetical protein